MSKNCGSCVFENCQGKPCVECKVYEHGHCKCSDLKLVKRLSIQDVIDILNGKGLK